MGVALRGCSKREQGGGDGAGHCNFLQLTKCRRKFRFIISMTHNARVSEKLLRSLAQKCRTLHRRNLLDSKLGGNLRAQWGGSAGHGAYRGCLDKNQYFRRAAVRRQSLQFSYLNWFCDSKTPSSSGTRWLVVYTKWGIPWREGDRKKETKKERKKERKREKESKRDKLIKNKSKTLLIFLGIFYWYNLSF